MINQLNPTFARRLLVADLIARHPRPSVPELMQQTGWPRRTLQDVIKALPSWGLAVEFVQDGVRNNDGYYRLDHWGPFDPGWIEQNRAALYRLFELQPD